jgi:hypothetical protein
MQSVVILDVFLPSVVMLNVMASQKEVRRLFLILIETKSLRFVRKKLFLDKFHFSALPFFVKMKISFFVCLGNFSQSLQNFYPNVFATDVTLKVSFTIVSRGLFYNFFFKLIFSTTFYHFLSIPKLFSPFLQLDTNP